MTAAFVTAGAIRLSAVRSDKAARLTVDEVLAAAREWASGADTFDDLSNPLARAHEHLAVIAGLLETADKFALNGWWTRADIKAYFGLDSLGTDLDSLAERISIEAIAEAKTIAARLIS